MKKEEKSAALRPQPVQIFNGDKQASGSDTGNSSPENIQDFDHNSDISLKLGYVLYFCVSMFRIIMCIHSTKYQFFTVLLGFAW